MKFKFRFKYLLYASLLLILFVGFEVVNNWILLQPKQQFEYQKEYKKFKIYSDNPIENDLELILDEVSFRLYNTLNFDKGEYEIFLCKRTEIYDRFAKKVGKSARTQGFNLHPLNYIFINVPFIQEIMERNTDGHKYSILEGNIAHIIAHEICHQLIANKIGYLKMRYVESWKLEGFCEYSASQRIKRKDNFYSYTAFAKDFFNGEYHEISYGRKFYIRSLLLTEYFIDQKRRSFNDLIDTKLSENELLEEIKRISL